MKKQIVLAVVDGGGESFISFTTFEMSQKQLSVKFYPLPSQNLKEEPVDVHSVSVHDNMLCFAIDDGPFIEFEI